MTLEIIQCKGKRPLAPRESTVTRKFWKKLSAGEFTTTQCKVCKRLMFPPRQHCPGCWSKDLQWTSLSGKGKLYARTTVYAAPDIFQEQIPYSVGIIDLDEGVRLIAAVKDEPERVNNDDRVQLAVLSYDDGVLFTASKLL